MSRATLMLIALAAVHTAVAQDSSEVPGPAVSFDVPSGAATVPADDADAVTAGAANEPAPAAAAPSAPSADEAGTPSAPRASNGAAYAGDIRLETTSVSGNRELPRVMVIVPWKSADPVELGGRPLSSLVEEALTPIDRQVFRRELDYYSLLRDGDAGRGQLQAQSETESQ